MGGNGRRTIRIGKWEIDRQELSDTIRFFFVLLLLINAYYEGQRVIMEVVRYVNDHADYCIYAYPQGFTAKIIPLHLYYCLYPDQTIDYATWQAECGDLISTPPPTLTDISNIYSNRGDGGYSTS
jgi:hypothetical protein